jgi:hypothetical protein
VDYPKQSQSPNATIAFRDRVRIMADEASGGASQPAYTDELAASLPAEVVQTSGGEYVRGKQVEAVTAFVVCLRFDPQMMFTAKCQVTILSGVYRNQVLYVHRVLYEDRHGRPVRIQLHCKRTE